MSLSFQAFRNSHFVKQYTSAPEEDSHDCTTDLRCIALNFHNAFCRVDDCEWDAEYHYMPDEWVGEEHQKWLRIAAKTSKAGLTFQDSIAVYDEVMQRIYSS